MSADHEDNRG